ncbi:reverse transcriptase domain, Reverse transcriptase zinc-binding domain protein [Artemisia annua]|uniref:Reverse transcriptase domain, Reverse transcriptase zinc-binding domain protein n=1 Tax=Artemisia annua TaxID=35608 RepID=A0A2U1MPK6_ARTAN|nr:reverse transcriptase domain, Reverse transcriptase zinc-binding domain protein [Artemisia annua]
MAEVAALYTWHHTTAPIGEKNGVGEKEKIKENFIITLKPHNYTFRVYITNEVIYAFYTSLGAIGWALYGLVEKCLFGLIDCRRVLQVMSNLIDGGGSIADYRKQEWLKEAFKALQGKGGGEDVLALQHVGFAAKEVFVHGLYLLDMSLGKRLDARPIKKHCVYMPLVVVAKETIGNLGGLFELDDVIDKCDGNMLKAIALGKEIRLTSYHPANYLNRPRRRFKMLRMCRFKLHMLWLISHEPRVMVMGDSGKDQNGVHMNHQNGVHMNRHLMMRIIEHRNGENTSAWFDKWHDHGPLDAFITHRDIYHAGFNSTSTVKEVVHINCGMWPYEWIMKYDTLASINVPMLNDRDDKLRWKDENGNLNQFSVRSVWEAIRPRGNSVSWFHVVWFSQCIPRHAFLTWLLMGERLKTQDTLRSWDVPITVNVDDLRCPLCKTVQDSHAHLFFECPFSIQVWFKAKKLHSHS